MFQVGMEVKQILKAVSLGSIVSNSLISLNMLTSAAVMVSQQDNYNSACFSSALLHFKEYD